MARKNDVKRQRRLAKTQLPMQMESLKLPERSGIKSDEAQGSVPSPEPMTVNWSPSFGSMRMQRYWPTQT
jgi:hypothetical protein